jgi:hypothetical protein
MMGLLMEYTNLMNSEQPKQAIRKERYALIGDPRIFLSIDLHNHIVVTTSPTLHVQSPQSPTLSRHITRIPTRHLSLLFRFRHSTFHTNQTRQFRDIGMVHSVLHAINILARALCHHILSIRDQKSHNHSKKKKLTGRNNHLAPIQRLWSHGIYML